MKGSSMITFIEFSEIQGNAPVFTCNWCGREGQATGWLAGDVAIPDNSGDTVTLVFCSDTCRLLFVSHPNSIYYIADLLERVMSVRGASQVHDARNGC